MNIIFVLMQLPSVFFSMQASRFLLPFRKGWWWKALLFIAFYLLTSMVIFIGDPHNLPPTLLFFMAAFFLCCQGSLLQKCTVGLMVASTAFAFNALVDNLSNLHDPTRLFLRCGFWILFYFMMRYFAPPKDYELSPALWRLLLLLTITPLGVTCSLVLLTSPYYIMTSSVIYAFIACLSFAFLSFVGLLWATTVLAKQRRMEMDSLMSETNKRYYESMEQHQFEVRRLRHDLANHLQILASLPAGEKDSYLRELIESPAMKNTLHYCADSTVNAVLSAKALVIKQEAVGFEVNADITDELPFEQVDICALLANAIDNAVEACLKLPHGSRRIELRLRAQKGMFAVSASNPMPEDVSLDETGSLPKTSKKDRKGHGYGLKSIREIVTRYHGSMEVKAENGEFQLFLYMPMVEKA